MKKVLFIISLLAFSLSACSKRSPAEQAEPDARHRKLEALSVAGANSVSLLSTTYAEGYGDVIRRFCIEGTMYTTYEKSIVQLRSVEDKPVPCSN